MQALNTSGILELMENLGSSGECQVHFGPFQRYKWSNLYIFISARFTLVKDINILVVFNSKILISRQGALLSRLPSYCKIKDNLPSMDKILRLMHLARLTVFSTSWRLFLKNPFPAIFFSSNPMEIKGDTVEALNSEKLNFGNPLPRLSFLPQCFFDKVGGFCVYTF